MTKKWCTTSWVHVIRIIQTIQDIQTIWIIQTAKIRSLPKGDNWGRTVCLLWLLFVLINLVNEVYLFVEKLSANCHKVETQMIRFFLGKKCSHKLSYVFLFFLASVGIYSTMSRKSKSACAGEYWFDSCTVHAVCFFLLFFWTFTKVQLEHLCGTLVGMLIDLWLRMYCLQWFAL